MMVRFLISRPIAVSMTFFSLFILGYVASRNIPVSLMPSVNVPEITVQTSYPNLSARQMENNITAPLRRQLLQVPGLDDMESESRAGSVVIRLQMEYGTNMHHAFVAVNEKIDMAMQILPDNMKRPRVIKASIVDIPVLSLNITRESDRSTMNSVAVNEKDYEDLSFLELSGFAESVIKRRFEQLPEVALVDISGMAFPEIVVVPDTIKMKNLNITVSDIDKVLNENNNSLGSILVREGQYQYHIKVASTLSNIRDVSRLFINKNEQLFSLGEIAEIKTMPVRETGVFISDGKRGVTLSVIKQSEARMEVLKEKIHFLIKQMKTDYPELNFEVVRDQSRLLDVAISSLEQSLILGGAMAFLVLFFFLKDARAPLLIGISIPTSVMVSLLFFKMAGLTVNIVSLSGLVLGVGMMIDNSIIVIDNISQYLDRGKNLLSACVLGTNEVIRPLLSSVLTTCAVFLPLIFLSGISGAIFYDQAMAVTIGLFTSLGVSITLLPVYFHLFYKGKFLMGLNNWLKKYGFIKYEGAYLKGYNIIFSNRKSSLLIFVILASFSVLIYPFLEKERFPVMPKKDLILKIDWNENINLIENHRRSNLLMAKNGELVSYYDALIGEQQFLLSKSHIQGQEETVLYIETASEIDLEKLQENIKRDLNSLYPSATFQFEKSANIFEQIFSDRMAPFEVRLVQGADRGETFIKDLLEIRNNLMDSTGLAVAAVNTHKEINVKIDHEKLLIYNVSLDDLIEKLRGALNSKQLSEVKSNTDFIPVRLGNNKQDLGNVISTGFVLSSENVEIPIRELITLFHGEGLKSIIGGKEGEFYPFRLDITEKELAETERITNKIVQNYTGYRALYKGSIYNNQEMIWEMIWVMLVSLLLLYFILAAQFESLWQPIIVLSEVPINLAASFFMLYLFNSSINIMSLIGIIVMCGIIINDSILKIDTINRLVKSGYSVAEAVKIGGERRLKPILMTSITTVLALLPFLFSSDLGSVLQRPLALVIIGGMVLGTIVSLYYVPLFYLLVKSFIKSEDKQLFDNEGAEIS